MILKNNQFIEDITKQDSFEQLLEKMDNEVKDPPDPFKEIDDKYQAKFIKWLGK